MKKNNPKIEKAMKKVVKKMVDSELYEWPPQCATFYYQPVRPRKNITDETPNVVQKLDSFQHK